MNRVPRGLRIGVVLILFSCVGYCAGTLSERSRVERFPSFPWPPPRASATELIPRDVFLRGNENVLLSDVDKQLNRALQQNGYFDKKYFAVPDGFALVTRLEQIERDGSPKPEPQRWELEDDALSGPFTLDRILFALFLARPGFYRVIVFTITPHPFEQAHAKVSAESPPVSG